MCIAIEKPQVVTIHRIGTITSQIITPLTCKRIENTCLFINIYKYRVIKLYKSLSKTLNKHRVKSNIRAKIFKHLPDLIDCGT